MNATRALLGATALLAVAAFLVACSGGGGAAASATPPPGTDASIDAKDHKFSSTELVVPAGEPFQLFLRNLDGAPHNVAIYTNDSAATPIFVGDTVTNAAVTYDVPAIKAGVYFFRCDVHPDMTGTVRVAADAAHPPTVILPLGTSGSGRTAIVRAPERRPR